MILRQDIVRENSDKPRIPVPIILHEGECVTNEAIESSEFEYVRIWDPHLWKVS